MKASNYRRLPLEFEAIRWDSNPETAHAVEAWTKASGQATRYDVSTGVLLITTQEGGVGCKAGDYLVRGIEGEVYPVIERRFKALYESANPLRSAPECVSKGRTVSERCSDSRRPVTSFSLERTSKTWSRCISRIK